MESPARREARRERKKARRLMMKMLTKRHGKAVAERMMKGKDVDHKKPLGAGGSSRPSNLRLRSEHSNRADKAGLDGRSTRPGHRVTLKHY